MLFNEIYSVYYNTVAKIIAKSIQGGLDEKTINKIITDNAFGESVVSIIPLLKNEKWRILHSDFTTPIKHKPTMPLTLIQKQWLKAILSDSRIKLFIESPFELDNIEPLFTSDDYHIYDKASDSDPYDDDNYIKNFRTILSALKSKRSLTMQIRDEYSDVINVTVIPVRLEYSEKDDKFRLITSSSDFAAVINLAHVVSCEPDFTVEEPICTATAEYCELTLKIHNQRNALERCLLHFAHFEKRTERIDNSDYLLHIKYIKQDESEMVIRVLGFGPLIEVVSPDSFVTLITNRLKNQKKL